jgi:hypothetical protein
MIAEAATVSLFKPTETKPQRAIEKRTRITSNNPKITLVPSEYIGWTYEGAKLGKPTLANF